MPCQESTPSFFSLLFSLSQESPSHSLRKKFVTGHTASWKPRIRGQVRAILFSGCLIKAGTRAEAIIQYLPCMQAIPFGSIPGILYGFTSTAGVIPVLQS